MYLSPEYKAWGHMKERCYNSNCVNYKNYGARGITLCDRWKDFINFYQDMGTKPSNKHSLERIDNNGNYEPNNCKWATRGQQLRNKRSNRILRFKNKSMVLTDWAFYLKMPYSTLAMRLKRGWTVERALSS